MKRIAYTLIFASGFLLAACSGPPANYVLLEEARSAYRHAQNDSVIAANAPGDLKAAEEALAKSEALWRENEDEARINHYAYLARQYVRIAEEKARLKTAEAEIEQAELERKEVQLEARTREAEQAEREAEQAQREARRAQQTAAAQKQEAESAKAEAERARRAAQAALARAKELAERVEELEARQTERGLVLTLGDVLFDVDKATLKPGGLLAVDKLALFLEEYPERTVLIEGHTDNTGTEEYNLDLSRRRADAVRLALLEREIDEARIRIHGYGEAYPVAGNDTAAGRQQNRRVEVVISNEDSELQERASTR